MQVLKEDIRGRILTIARQQFEKKGYSKTSMREIAELAGVGVGNIYNYFTNKDELFREVELLTPEISKIEDIRYISYSELCELLNNPCGSPTH